MAAEAPSTTSLLLFCFFVRSLGPAPSAPLLEFNFAGNKLLVLARPIIGARARGARKPYQLILRHVAALYST